MIGIFVQFKLITPMYRIIIAVLLRLFHLVFDYFSRSRNVDDAIEVIGIFENKIGSQIAIKLRIKLLVSFIK